jgi:ribonuclease Z
MAFRGRSSNNPLHIYGPVGLLKVKEAIFNLGYFSVDFPIMIHEISNNGSKIENVVETEKYIVECIKTHHNVINLSYSFYEKKKPRFLREKAINLGVKPGSDFGKLHNGGEVEVDGKIIKAKEVLGPSRSGVKIVYSGDTAPCEGIIELARNADILIHESTYKNEDSDKAINNAHSTSSQVAKIAKQANVVRLILTHISTRYTKIDDLKDEALKIFKNTEVAYDLMNIEL